MGGRSPRRKDLQSIENGSSQMQVIVVVVVGVVGVVVVGVVVLVVELIVS